MCLFEDLSMTCMVVPQSLPKLYIFLHFFLPEFVFFYQFFYLEYQNQLTKLLFPLIDLSTLAPTLFNFILFIPPSNKPSFHTYTHLTLSFSLSLLISFSFPSVQACWSGATNIKSQWLTSPK